MTQSNTISLTAQDIQAIERRAQAMRSQAIAGLLRAGATALVAKAQKLVGFLQRPRHA